MSIEHTLVCDNCSRIIAAASNATTARQDGQRVGYERRNNRDLCLWCVEADDAAKPKGKIAPCDDAEFGMSP